MIQWQFEKMKLGFKGFFYKVIGKKNKIKNSELSRRLKRQIEEKFSFKIDSDNYIVCLDSFPIYLRRNTSDIHVFEEIFILREYVSVVETLIHNRVEIKVIIDVGANIGVASRFFHQNFPEAQFICVEPDSENYRMMKKNLEGIKNLKAYNNAIWSSATQLKIHNKFRDGKEWSLSVSANADVNGIDVSAITLDWIIDENALEQIDLLKIDIEGAEFELFKNNCEYFLSFVRVLVLEVHPEVDDANVIIAKLKANNFLIYIIKDLIIGFNLRKFNF